MLYVLFVAAVVGLLWVCVEYVRVLAVIGSAPIPKGIPTEVAAAELRSTDRTLASLQVMLGVSVIFSIAFPVLLAIFAGLYARDWIDERVRSQTASAVAKELGRSQRRTHALLYNHLAVIEWRRLHDKKDLEYAIELGAGALRMEPEDLEVIMSIKSNLAYFYAEAQVAERREQALEYAKETRAYYKTKPESKGLLANDVYVRMQYARASDVAVLKALAIEIRDLMVDHPTLRAELQTYLDELLAKCPEAKS